MQRLPHNSIFVWKAEADAWPDQLLLIAYGYPGGALIVFITAGVTDALATLVGDYFGEGM